MLGQCRWRGDSQRLGSLRPGGQSAENRLMGCGLDERALVIVLNGVGSVGKTSTARALQEISERPLLHVSMDGFIGMMPARMFGHPDGLVFAAKEENGNPLVQVSSGPVMKRAMSGMRHAIAAMAAQGNDLIVDDVMFDAREAQEYRELLAGFDLRMVGLFASLEVLEQRERARGDREIGLARWQYKRVHQGMVYDLEIDTDAVTVMQSAEMIRESFGL